LGDGVYVSYDGFMIELTTLDNVIYLEEAVLDALFAYCIKNRILFQEGSNV
jgi:hypothetical protein